MPPVVETGERPVMVPPMTTRDPSSIGFRPPTVSATLETVGSRVGKTTPRPDEKRLIIPAVAPMMALPVKGVMRDDRARVSSLIPPVLMTMLIRVLTPETMIRTPPGHAFKALTFASAMEHKKDRRHGKGDQTDIELKKDNQDAHDDKARKGQELLFAKGFLLPIFCFLRHRDAPAFIVYKADHRKKKARNHLVHKNGTDSLGHVDARFCKELIGEDPFRRKGSHAA